MGSRYSRAVLRVTAATVMFAVALAGSPALADHAKVLRAIVTGSGISPRIVIQGPDVYTLTISLGVVPDAGTAGPPAPSAKDLGTGYTIHYFEQLLNGDTFSVRQVLYPFATDGPWVYTPSGQRFFDDSFGGAFAVRPGWWDAPQTSEAIHLLQARGFPVVTHTMTLHPDPWLTYLLLVLLPALVAGVVLFLRRRPAPKHIVG